jgi:gas vesicle protein GvpA/GvpJ/GvpM family
MKRRKGPRSSVPASHPVSTARRPPLPRRVNSPRPPRRALPPAPKPRIDTATLVPAAQTSLADVIDNLLNRGVVLNADVILALADVDLVYVRLSALVCAADRVLPARK